MVSVSKNFRYTLIFLVGMGTYTYPQDTLSTDAIILTLRMQEGIWLDSTLARHIDSALTVTREAYDTLTIYHTWLDYVPNMLLMGLDTFSASWDNGYVFTGDSSLDSLNTHYHSESVNPVFDIAPYYTLTFAQPLQMERLANVYLTDPAVIWAGPNYNGEYGPNIWAMFKYNSWLFIFLYGWGDCPAGCIHRDYWYVSLDSNRVPLLEEILPDDHPTPYFHQWNIPTA